MKSDLLGGVLLLHHAGVSYESECVGEHALYPRYTRRVRENPESSAHVHSLLRLGEPQATSMQVWTPLLQVLNARARSQR